MRTRTPQEAGDRRRKRNMSYLEFLVELGEGEGYLREQLVRTYAYDTGLTEKKATEHLDLLIAVGRLEEDDLTIYKRKPKK